MSIIGIVCEYNPFHNGHEYHIAMSKKKLGEDASIVCVMSGDFVQRGEAAMYSKYARAEAACRCGVDLVLELPLPWCLSSAEGFARGAVGLLGGLGAGYISFGSECGETEPLEEIAQTLLEPAVNARVREILNENASLSYAAARQIAAEERLGELAGQLELPNNILAVEYIKAIYDLRLEMKPMTVRRFGAGHDVSGDGRGPRSASELRRLISSGKDTGEHIPSAAASVYARERERGRELADRALLETAMLSRLRMLSQEDFLALPDAGDGAGARLCRAAREEASLDAVLAAAKTRRYALSRIRRMCLCACLGVKAGMNTGTPPYARVMAANEKGRAIIRAQGGAEGLEILTKPAAVKNMSAESGRLFAMGASAHDMFVLGYRAPGERRGGEDWRTGPVIVNN